MSEQHAIVDVSEPHADVRVHLLRPSAGATIGVGTRINGIGWVVSNSPVSSVEIRLGNARPRRALLGISAADLATLTGHVPLGDVTGFVFTVNVPPLPPGPVRLALGVQTERGRYDDDVELDVAGTAGLPSQPPSSLALDPIRAMIEAAQIDTKGVLRVSGWAVSLSPIESLQVFLGARLLGEAQRGILREDLPGALPDYPEAALGGFLLRLEVTEEDLARKEVHVVVAARSGIQQRFTAPLARPNALQRRPMEPVADLSCEEALLTGDGNFAIKGWAVASSGVAEITVELDETVIGTTLPAEARPDVGNRYPRIAGARQAGFRLRRRLPERFSGDHVVRVKVRGQDGEEYSVFQIVSVQQATPETVLLPPTDPVPSEQQAGDEIRCFLDLPACRDGAATETARGFLSLSGWAFGVAGIAGVEVFVDGVSQGRAHHGIRREDLGAAFPEDDGALLAGFAMVLPPQVMKPGRHDLQQAILAATSHVPRWSLVMLAPSGSAALADIYATLDSLTWQAADWSLTLLAVDETSAARLEAALRATPEYARLRVVVIQPDRKLCAVGAYRAAAVGVAGNMELRPVHPLARRAADRELRARRAGRADRPRRTPGRLDHSAGRAGRADQRAAAGLRSPDL